MTAEQRGVWADLLALAGEAKLRDGTLRFDIGKPMTQTYIAGVLRIPSELLASCIDLFANDLNTENGQPRIKVWDDGTIELTNFTMFQSQKGKSEDKKEAVEETPLIREHREKAQTARLARRHPGVAEEALTSLHHEEALITQRDAELAKLKTKGKG